MERPVARETAEIIAAKLAPDLKPEDKKGLAPMDDVKETAKEINMGDRDVLIVGHLPHLAKLTSFLITGNDSLPVVIFQQGALLCLERGEGGKWCIAWMLVPEMIRGKAV